MNRTEPWRIALIPLVRSRSSDGGLAALDAGGAGGLSRSLNSLRRWRCINWDSGNRLESSGVEDGSNFIELASNYCQRSALVGLRHAGFVDRLGLSADFGVERECPLLALLDQANGSRGTRAIVRFCLTCSSPRSSISRHKSSSQITSPYSAFF